MFVIFLKDDILPQVDKVTMWFLVFEIYLFLCIFFFFFLYFLYFLSSCCYYYCPIADVVVAVEMREMFLFLKFHWWIIGNRHLYIGKRCENNVRCSLAFITFPSSLHVHTTYILTVYWALFIWLDINSSTGT